MTKELISQLYSSDAEVKRAAIYRVLFDRRHDLLSELKKAVSFEQNEQIAVFMVQVCLTLEAFPRDLSIERRILELLQRGTGAGELQPSMWKYLETHGSSQMLIATLGAMGEAIPPDAQDFIEVCLNHPDPEVRSMACEKAIKSGRPTHFAYVLNLITDPDPLVSETAFSVVHSLPVNELAIILDYALGSPDEWVLNNVAPFLPNLVNNGLRQVIAKVQYHKHPLVSRKAREALKALDAIPYVTKRGKKGEETEATSEGAPENTVTDKPVAAEEEKAPSFKEQMELKRQQKMEEDRRRREEDEALAKDLAGVKPEEIASFASDLEDFDVIASGGSQGLATGDDLPLESENFTENTSFESEAAMLEAIDENSVIVEETPAAAEVTAELDLEKAGEQMALAGAAIEPEPEVQLPPVATVPIVQEVQTPVTASTSTSATPEQTIAAKPETVAAPAAVPAQPLAPAVEKAVPSKVQSQVPVGQGVAGKPAVLKAEQPRVAVPAPSLPIPAAAREVIARYPSFLSDSFALLFRPSSPEAHLKVIGQVVDNLTAFLNLCFLQSCMYFAEESDVLARSIRECLKGNLIGPTALRCLHNFALSMKAARGNPVFFTFSLAGIFSESSDTNPLMLMRELKEYLREPAEPLEESVPQAIEGLTDILRGVKSILNNTLVMRAPKGAKEPFADLSGPEATILKPDKRPALDLPVGEIVLISRDGTEALGLYPFFKYEKKKVHFARPDERETAIFYERLEIPLD